MPTALVGFCVLYLAHACSYARTRQGLEQELAVELAKRTKLTQKLSDVTGRLEDCEKQLAAALAKVSVSACMCLICTCLHVCVLACVISCATWAQPYHEQSSGRVVTVTYILVTGVCHSKASGQPSICFEPRAFFLRWLHRKVLYVISLQYLRRLAQT